MYFCIMQDRPKLIQLSISTDENFRKRFSSVAELKEDQAPRLQIIALPDWLVFYSEKFQYCCINLN